MLSVKANNMNEIYATLVAKILKSEKVSDTHEIQNVNFELTNPTKNISQNRTDTKYGLSLTYALGELVWYLSGSNSMKFISKFGKIWEKLSDDGITNNSAYGYVLKKQSGFNQIKIIEDLLKKDKNSRRAVLNINRANKSVYSTNDEPCTIALQLLIRNNKLNMTAIMRSNDLWFGTPYDVLFFTFLQQIIAKDLHVDLGIYHHFATSMHIYDRNIEALSKVKQQKYDDDISINPFILNNYSKLLYKKIENMNREDAREKLVNMSSMYKII